MQPGNDFSANLLADLDTADPDTVVQWTERHVVLLMDKQILRFPAPAGNIGRRGERRATLLQASRKFELVCGFRRFKRRSQKF
jgi:hypothetical protein